MINFFTCAKIWLFWASGYLLSQEHHCTLFYCVVFVCMWASFIKCWYTIKIKKNIHEGLTSKTSCPFVWPLKSQRIGDDAAQDKGLEWQITEKKGRPARWKWGCRQTGNWAQSPAQHATLQASSSPASKSPEISPEPLRQIIVINNKSPPLRPLPDSPASPPRGKTNGPGSRCPGDWTLTSPPSRWPSVSNFVCLFVYPKTPETAAAGRVIFTGLWLKGTGGGE